MEHLGSSQILEMAILTCSLVAMNIAGEGCYPSRFSPSSTFLIRVARSFLARGFIANPFIP